MPIPLKVLDLLPNCCSETSSRGSQCSCFRRLASRLWKMRPNEPPPRPHQQNGGQWWQDHRACGTGALRPATLSSRWLSSSMAWRGKSLLKNAIRIIPQIIPGRSANLWIPNWFPVLVNELRATPKRHWSGPYKRLKADGQGNQWPPTFAGSGSMVAAGPRRVIAAIRSGTMEAKERCSTGTRRASRFSMHRWPAGH